MDTFSSLKALGLADLIISGKIYANFTDIRDAQKAHAKVKAVRVDWNIQYIAAPKSASPNRSDSTNFAPLSLHEGQVVIRADFNGPCQQFNARSIGQTIRELLENCGDIMGYDTWFMKPPTATFRAEYFDCTAVDNALTYLSGLRIGVCDCYGASHT